MLWDLFQCTSHTYYLRTCHSSVKVVEFRGSNLVIIGPDTPRKGEERANVYFGLN